MALGICLVLPMHILAMIVLGIIAYFVDHLGTGYSLDQYIFYAIFHIGITQLVYIIPVVILLWLYGKTETMKGVIVGAVITALLNGGCWLLVNTTFY